MRARLTALAVLALACSLAEADECEAVHPALQKCFKSIKKDDFAECLTQGSVSKSFQNFGECLMKEFKAIGAGGKLDEESLEDACDEFAACLPRVQGIPDLCNHCKKYMVGKKGRQTSLAGAECFCKSMKHTFEMHQQQQQQQG